MEQLILHFSNKKPLFLFNPCSTLKFLLVIAIVMEMGYLHRYLLIPSAFIMISILSLPALCSPKIASCLAEHSITNFTTLPSSENESSSYYELLNYSIHNLRFSGPSVPKPTAIIFPGSVEQLVASVLCCKHGGWEIRLRCGGHSYEGTSFVAADGASFVIIDLTNLNRVQVDLESETAWVEGGATLGETYYAISEASRTYGFSAGSCPTVGVGGHISGGGYGLMSRKYGLAADNVVDAMLIDSNGQLLDRQAMGEDVFWAIRGGGGGIWGIVYAWKIKLLKVPEIVTCFIVSTSGTKDQVAKQLNHWQRVAPTLEEDFYLSAFVRADWLQEEKTRISATFKGLFLGPRKQAISILEKRFPELGIREEDCAEMSWIESVVFFGDLEEGSSTSELKNRFSDNHYFKAKSDFVRSPVSLGGIKAALDMLEMEPKGYVILDPYGGILGNISSTSIPFPHREGNLFSIQYLVEWHEEDNDRSHHYLRSSKDEGNDAVQTARAWGEKYFLGNYERLVRAKTIIDPENVFRNQQGIPPMSIGSMMLQTSRPEMRILLAVPAVECEIATTKLTRKIFQGIILTIVEPMKGKRQIYIRV